MAIAKKSNNKQRRFGSYYTPLSVAESLTRWAIRSPADTVLEPSFGGCGFIEAAASRLAELGSHRPVDSIYGCDKDKRAFSYLADFVGVTELGQRFVHADFLGVVPEDFRQQSFKVIVGNPPYVSMHTMTKSQRKSSVAAMDKAGYQLDKKASLWAYFVLYALEFLAKGGRCAWVLPSSFLHAEYARYVRQMLDDRFSSVVAISMEERLFEHAGAKECSIVLLADGYAKGMSGGHSYYQVVDSAGLQELIEGASDLGAGGRADKSGVSNDVENCLKKLNYDSYLLSDLADVKIGIVTGANNFFVIDRGLADEWKLPSFALRSIFAKFHQTSGVELTDADLAVNEDSGMRCLLVNALGTAAQVDTVRDYLSSFPEDRKRKNATFKKRSVWHLSDDGRTPDAFLSYMSQHGPRLVLNAANTTSTNTIHRIYFKNQINSSQRKLLTISLLSTYSQLSAELVGRSYGSGVLKLEPSEARMLRALMPASLKWPEIRAAYNRVDRSLRAGDAKSAQAIADELVMKGRGGAKVIRILNQELERQRAKRARQRMK